MRQFGAPVDELVSVAQADGEGDELDLVTTQALGLGGHVVKLGGGERWNQHLISTLLFFFLNKQNKKGIVHIE